MLTGDQLEAWKKKRRSTMIMTAIHRVLYGIQYSNVFATLWIYLTTLVQSDHPYLWYSIISVSFHVSGIIITLIVGRISDKTRDIRACFLVATALTIIGNILYSLPYSIYYVFAGRFVSGSIVATRPLVTGEVVRVYEEDEVLRMLSVQGMCFGLGLTVGPAMNFIFVNFDFTIGSLHLTYANAPSLFLSFVFAVMEILMVFFLHNLSKEFDLKDKRTKAENKLQHFALTTASDIRGLSTKCATSIGGRNNTVQNPQQIISTAAFEIQDPFTNHFGSNDNKFVIENDSVENSQLNDAKQSCTDCSPDTDLSLSAERELFGTNAVDHHENHSSHSNTVSNRQIVALQYLDESLEHDIHEDTSFLIQDDVPGVAQVLCKMLVNFDSVFIILSTCLLNSIYNSSEFWTPIVVTKLLNWGAVELNAIFLASGIVSILMTLGIAAIKMHANTYFNLNLFVILGLVVLEGTFIVLKLYYENNNLNIAMYSIHSLLVGVTFAYEDAFLANILAQMLPSSVQSLGESIRLTFLRIASIVTLFTGGLVFNWIEYVATGLAVCLILQFFVMICRKKYLMRPKFIL